MPPCSLVSLYAFTKISYLCLPSTMFGISSIAGTIQYILECSTGAIPEDGPSKSPSSITPTDLLKCAKDSNMVIKLMKVKVDGQDVSSHIIRQSTSQPFKFFIPPENAVAYKTPPSGGNNTSMAENYYLFFKPLPVGQHTIELEVIRVPTVSTQPVEHPIAKWDIKVVP